MFRCHGAAVGNHTVCSFIDTMWALSWGLHNLSLIIPTTKTPTVCPAPCGEIPQRSGNTTINCIYRLKIKDYNSVFVCGPEWGRPQTVEFHSNATVLDNSGDDRQLRRRTVGGCLRDTLLWDIVQWPHVPSRHYARAVFTDYQSKPVKSTDMSRSQIHRFKSFI